jgi:hypothetical protein
LPLRYRSANGTNDSIIVLLSKTGRGERDEVARDPTALKYSEISQMANQYHFYQAASNMLGPYDLTKANVARLPDSPGVYLLGSAHSRGTLVMYVGRSVSLPKRLAAWVGQYNLFFYKTTDSENGAFFTECHEFHRYGKAGYLDNDIHPAKPANSSLPVCAEPGCRGEAY